MRSDAPMFSVPSPLIQPARYPSAIRSTMPEPQMPTGGRFPIVSICSAFFSSIFTPHTAPGSARIPDLLTPPSSAGPAAPAPTNR